ncbi:speriolin-like protein [Labrus mixtus]|uniref:speriolin-like protein n=1 Tax=Labrus mixtus TaxID=508554 RepID=UPI0029C0DB4B|nr:speriolin-like protein [Labrus mixtus]
MDLEQTVGYILSKYEQLEQEIDVLKKERARMQSFNGDTCEELPVCSTSGRKPSCLWQNTCEEKDFRKDLQLTKVKHEHRTSSPVNFKSFLQSSMHTDRSEMLEFQSCQADISLNVKDSNRLLGEIAFQLDRRILSYIFQGHRRHYGFTLLNIPNKITEVSTHPLTGKLDEGYRLHLTQRYADLMERLSQLGYKTALHPAFTEFVVNTFGILRERPVEHSNQGMHLNNPDFLKKVLMTTAPGKLQKDLLLVLTCLCNMAQRDGRPLLLW